MKKNIFLLFILSLFTEISAQSYTQNFNEVFQHVDLSHTSTGILYERVLPISNLVNYQTITPCPVDTSDYWHFIMAYDELYRAGAQYNFLTDSVELMLKHLPSNGDTVVIGLLHVNFNTFDTSAVLQRLYFDTDSVLRENTAVNVSLFKEDTVFMTAPLVEQTYSYNVKFIVDEHFIFDNTTNPITSLKIDFGDGNGERTVNINAPININYNSQGIKVIRITATLFNGIVVVSYSKLDIGNDNRSGSGTSSYPYTEDLSVYGQIVPSYPYTDGGGFETSRGDLRIYYANADLELRKPVLIVDGFDPLNNRRFDTCYAKGEKSLWEKLGDGLNDADNVGNMLLSLGYDVVLLDLPEGGTFIEQNAMVCIEAINVINERLRQSGSDEQIVVVGPSMGGQITRYALAYMEQHPEFRTNYGNHNSRLWISFDSPHQGANISIGIQGMVEEYRLVLKKLWKKQLCCNAAKQMLFYHKQNGASAYYQTYYEQITDMDYPNTNRKIAVSNGSLNNIPNGIASYESLALSAIFPYFINVKIRNMAHQGSCDVYEIIRHICFIPISTILSFSHNDNRGSLDVAPGCKYNTFDIITNKLLAFQILGVLHVDFNQHSHCFMPVTSVLDYSDPVPYATDFSNQDLVATGKIPFDSYWGPLGKNMEHISFDYDLVNYLINEIETYIQGPREVQLCSRPTYTLHLPQDSVATVTWSCSDSIRLITGSNPYEVTVVPLATGDGWISAEVSTLKHRKRLANYPIHIFQNSFPEIDTVNYVTDTLHVNTTMLLGSTLCVDSNKTVLVSSTLHCAPSARIIVKPGGKLIVDGGTLTSACAGEMWQGIYVEGHRAQHQTAANQGSVQLLNGAVIENALCGILTCNPADSLGTTGGIITADSATFRNCAKAVEYLSYAETNFAGYLIDNLGNFFNCTFTVDDNNLFAANNTDFLTHVKLWDVKGVTFTHCRFQDLRAQSHTRKTAVSSIDAGFKVKNGCNYTLPPNQPDCNCHLTTNTNCWFEGFRYAISAATSGTPYPVIIDGAHFSNNVTGVKIEGNSHAEVTRCMFDLNMQTESSSKPAIGLSLDTCTGYLVEENNFSCSATAPQHLRFGMMVGNSGPDANSIYRNAFSNMSYGVYVQGNNGIKNTGLQFSCNDFSDNGYDIYVETNSTICNNQGNSTKGADNTFTSTQTSNLYYSGSIPVNYYYSPGSNHAPSLTTNVVLYGNATANTCSSTLCGINPDTPGGGPKSPTPGFLSLKEQYENLLADYSRNGYANLLATAIPPQAEPPATSDELVAAQYAARQINAIATELYAQSHAAVRSLMADTQEDVQAVLAWLDATPGLASRYLEAEAETNGRASLQDIANHISTPAERDEYDNYVAFQTLKDALAYGNGHVAWPHATDAQVWELVHIADANTGRSSLLAKNVLCFFFGICYDDDMETRALAVGNHVETRHGTSLHGNTHDIIIYPNPTDDVLHVSVTDGEIARVEMFDAFGRITMVGTQNLASPPSQKYTVDLSSLPSGVYVLRVTLRDGTVCTKKIVKR